MSEKELGTSIRKMKRQLKIKLNHPTFFPFFFFFLCVCVFVYGSVRQRGWKMVHVFHDSHEHNVERHAEGPLRKST